MERNTDTSSLLSVLSFDNNEAIGTGHMRRKLAVRGPEAGHYDPAEAKASWSLWAEQESRRFKAIERMDGAASCFCFFHYDSTH